MVELTSSVESHWHDALEWVLEEGEKVSPRGKPIRELLNFSFEVDSKLPLITNGVRKVNYRFAVAELTWYLLGRGDVESIARYNKNLAQFSADGATFVGAYGPAIAAQLPVVISQLREDADTRQAVLGIWRPGLPKTKDVPCTLTLQFLLRKEELHLIVNMRSNDLWLGFPYDVFSFTALQRAVAYALGVEPGSYHHNVGSLHVYESDLEKIERALNAYYTTKTNNSIKLPGFSIDSAQQDDTRVVFEEALSIAGAAKLAKLLENYDDVFVQQYLAILVKPRVTLEHGSGQPLPLWYAEQRAAMERHAQVEHADSDL